MKYKLKSSIDITIDEYSKKFFKEMMNWTEEEFKKQTIEIEGEEK